MFFFHNSTKIKFIICCVRFLNSPTSYNQLNITNATLAGTQIALRGFNNRATTAGNPGYSVGVQGLANSQNQDSYGVEGYSFSDAGITTGGYFEGLGGFKFLAQFFVFILYRFISRIFAPNFERFGFKIRE